MNGNEILATTCLLIFMAFWGYCLHTWWRMPND